jgi:NADH-quinone oxidoreductase subunit M
MGLFSQHLLSVILFVPLVGALLLMFIPREEQFALRAVGNLFGVLGFLVSLPLLLHFPAGSGDYEFREAAEWIPSIGAKFSLGADGISALLVILTTLLGMMAIASSWGSVQERMKEYYILLLLLHTGMLGVFLSLDMFLFYVFWEVMLVPMYFLISIWGGERRMYAATKFILYALAGSAVMLLAILALYVNYSNSVPPNTPATFDIPTLLGAARQFPDSLKVWLFWGFFFAFAIKVPMFPFHTWLPDALAEAPAAVSIVLAGVLLKTGAYGFLRVSLPLLPADGAARARIIHIVVALSIIGILYGAIACLMQKDLRRLIAYSCVSQLGFCILGIFALTPQGLTGSVLQQTNHGISMGGLILVAGALYARRRTQVISEFGGLATPMPNLAAMYMIVSLSLMGIPLLNGFIGQFAILQGVFQANKGWAAWAALGMVVGAAYLLSLYQRIMFGPIANEANKSLPDLKLQEWAVLLPLVALIFWIGIYPKPFLAFIEKPVERIIRQANPKVYPHPSSAIPAGTIAARAE